MKDKPEITDFTIRVYGISMNSRDEILVSDEKYGETFFTKFPGGGLKPGESTRDCLRREMMEEFNCRIAVGEHLYTTDIVVESLFLPGHQVMAIYYLFSFIDPGSCPFTEQPFDFDHNLPRGQSLRWVPLAGLAHEGLRFPTDQKALDILIRKFS